MKIKINDFTLTVKISFIILMIVLIALSCLEQFFVLFTLVILHELCHIICAEIFGVKCREIIVTPVGLCAVLNMESLSLFRKMVVVLSGPVFNILFGLLMGNSVSIALGIFNLFPVYPLDGGRLLGYGMGYFVGTLRANRYVMAISNMLCVIIIFLGIIQCSLFFGNVSLLLIGMFLYKENKRNTISLAYGFYKALIHKPNNKILRVRTLIANKNTSLKTIIYRLGTDYYTVVYVRDGEIVGMVSEDRLQSFITAKGISYNIIDVIKNL